MRKILIVISLSTVLFVAVVLAYGFNNKGQCKKFNEKIFLDITEKYILDSSEHSQYNKFLGKYNVRYVKIRSIRAANSDEVAQNISGLAVISAEKDEIYAQISDDCGLYLILPMK